MSSPPPDPPLPRLGAILPIRTSGRADSQIRDCARPDVRTVDREQVTIEPVDPAERRAQHCLAEYYAELDRRFDGGFDPERSRNPALDEMRPPSGAFLMATLRGEPVGCGALKLHSDSPAEIKRMWVAPSARGLGVGRRLLNALEARAAAAGAPAVRLDTNRALTEAIRMYRSAGYNEIAAFNDEPYAHHWFEKPLRG